MQDLLYNLRPTSGLSWVLKPSRPCHFSNFNSLHTMSFPSSTRVLVVGAGPAGMTCALSLWHSGVKDVTIVEAAEQGNGNTSRAMIIHAVTLEVRSCQLVDVVPSNATNRSWIISTVPMLWSNAGSRFLKWATTTDPIMF